MKKIALLLIAASIHFASVSQNEEDRTKIQSKTDLTSLNEIKTVMGKKFTEKNIEISNFLNNNLNYSRKYTLNGVTYEIKEIINGKPIYRSTDNEGAAQATKTNTLQPGGSLGLNLDGQGLYVGVWDGGFARTSHIEFTNNGNSSTRITLPDAVSPSPTFDGHATHVVGTIAAQGIDESAKGMAPAISVGSYDWNNDLVEIIEEINENGLLLSNHSYGVPVVNDSGNLNVPVWVMGAYTEDASNLDEVAFNAPYYLMVTSAGNNGADSYSGGIMDGFDKLTYEKNSKNNLVIANSNPFVTATGFLVNVVINGSSSQGPSDDGRIKPDLSGDGTSVYSTYSTNNTSYATLSGTSMASPNITGSLALLQQYYHQLTNVFMLSSTLKGLACHTARDAGNTGPDAKFGWGLLDAQKSAETILDSQNNVALILEGTLNNSETYTYTFDSSDIGPLEATICWTDPAGTPSTGGVNNPTPALVNDLDLRLTDSNSNIAYPWKLDLSDVSAPAIQGDNTVDNVEKVSISSPSSGTYTLTVTHKGTLVNGNQNFSLILTGSGLTLSNESFDLAENTLVWPNPTKDKINIRSNQVNNMPFNLELYDNLGRSIYNATNVFLSSTNAIDVNNFAPGIYYLNISNGANTTVKKIIIE